MITKLNRELNGPNTTESTNKGGVKPMMYGKNKFKYNIRLMKKNVN